MNGRWRVVVGILSLSLLAAAGGVWLLGGSAPARAGTAADFADRSVSSLTAFAQSSAALNLRLVALEVLRQKEGSTDDLAALVKGADVPLAVYAASALGRQGTEDARSALRDLVTESKAATEARKAAMSALAVHWKSESDLAWLAEKTADHAALKAHCTWLSSRVYGK
jgi:hypothetical protein